MNISINLERHATLAESTDFYKDLMEVCHNHDSIVGSITTDLINKGG